MSDSYVRISQAFQCLDEDKTGRLPLSQVCKLCTAIGMAPLDLLALLLASDACLVNYDTFIRHVFCRGIKHMSTTDKLEIKDVDVEKTIGASETVSCTYGELLDRLGEFKNEYGGQLTPIYPSDISPPKDDSTIVMQAVGKQGKENKVAIFPQHIVQRGKVNSIWVRFQTDCCGEYFKRTIKVWEDTVRDTMKRGLEVDRFKGWRHDAALGFGTLFVGFPEGSSFTSHDLQWLVTQGFQFSRVFPRRYQEGKLATENEIVYVKWVGTAANRLQPWATSIAGTRVFALSDDEETVCIIRENKNVAWGVPGGAVEMREAGFEAAARELWEETGLKANLQWCADKSVVLGGYNHACARDQLISDSGFVYAMKVHPPSDTESTASSDHGLSKFVQYVTPQEQKEEARLEEIKQVVWVPPKILAEVYDYFLLLEETKEKIRPDGLFGCVPLHKVKDDILTPLTEASGNKISKDDKIDCGLLCWAKTWVEGKGLKLQPKSGRFG